MRRAARPLAGVTAEEYLAALQLTELWHIEQTNPNIAWAIQLMRQTRANRRAQP